MAMIKKGDGEKSYMRFETKYINEKTLRFQIH